MRGHSLETVPAEKGVNFNFRSRSVGAAWLLGDARRFKNNFKK